MKRPWAVARSGVEVTGGEEKDGKWASGGGGARGYSVEQSSGSACPELAWRIFGMLQLSSGLI